GKEVYLSIRATPIKEKNGTTCGLICFLEDETDKKKLEEGLKQKIAELSIIDEVEKVLGSTLNLNEILEIILIAVTAGQGLGFNRAFLMLMDEKGAYLEGKMAIGASNREEAYRIWSNLSQQYRSLEDILKSYRSALEQKDIEVNQIVQKIRVPIREKDNPLIQSVLDKQARYLDENSCPASFASDLFQIIGSRKLALAPLISVDKVEGLILADNFVTGKEIKDEDLKLLQIFAHHAGSAIERSRLYQKLEQKLVELEEANRKIAENSKRMIKMERLQAIEEVTFQVAHELRNPMTIIGGFARSILKKIPPGDENCKSLEIIASQTERMEDLLTNFLDYVYVPENAVEELDLNQSIEQSLELLRSELNEKRIYLVKNLQPQLSKLHLNPELLGSCLVNILRYMLSNSISSGSLNITTQSFEGSVSLTLSLMPVYSIIIPDKSSSFALASTLIGNLGGNLRYKPEEKARLCLEINFFPKGGKDGQHPDRR
ncbi:MAG TPA: histidine kinase dimerization/phospho-acceptor domain-containing protein, partial [Terriglobales bacterium]|nr:histidine kinase dimerization/phospho-acceptor domain-containing protein [Terriglobales bacterium]